LDLEGFRRRAPSPPEEAPDAGAPPASRGAKDQQFPGATGGLWTMPGVNTLRIMFSENEERLPLGEEQGEAADTCAGAADILFGLVGDSTPSADTDVESRETPERVCYLVAGPVAALYLLGLAQLCLGSWGVEVVCLTTRVSLEGSRPSQAASTA